MMTQFTGGVARVGKHDELTSGPCSLECPGRLERAPEVELAMNEDTGDGREPIGLLEQLAFPQPRAVPKVVGHGTGEAHSKARIGVPRIGDASDS